MAVDGKEKPGASRVLLIVLVVGAAGLVGLSLYLNVQADRSLEDLQTAIDEYGQMANMKRVIESLKERGAGLPSGDKPQGNPLQFLSQKARQAQIPPQMLNVARNPSATTGEWEELPYTINLRAKKEEPIGRAPVVDFLRLVEEQRPSIKSKNLNLTFSGDAFSAVTITFSSFKRKSSSGATGSTPK